MKNFTDLDVWKNSRELAKSIYDITNDFPDKKKFRLTDKMCRVAVSIASNIAEGIGRSNSKDKMRFIYMSRGSSFELETQLYIAKDLHNINESKFSEVLESILVVKKLINGFIIIFKNQLNRPITKH